MGMMSRGGSMGDTKVGATISKRDMRVPLAKLNRATRLTIKQPLCDSEQALLDYICKIPAMIDPGQPFASPEERVLISDALGIAYTPDNIVNGALKKARRAERRRLGLPDRPRGRPMGAAGHGAHALSLHWIPCQNGLTDGRACGQARGSTTCVRPSASRRSLRLMRVFALRCNCTTSGGGSGLRRRPQQFPHSGRVRGNRGSQTQRAQPPETPSCGNCRTHDRRSQVRKKQCCGYRPRKKRPE